MQTPNSEYVLETFAAVTIVSAASIGSNFVEVRKGKMSPSLAIGNGVAKGVIAQTLLSKPPESTAQTFVAAGCLALSAYVIDSVMKSPALNTKHKQKKETVS